jgi:hypothetical protein
VLVNLEPFEVRETFIEVRPARSQRAVTVLEILSPSNKAGGSPGREQYLAKQRELLRSPTHLLEVDLLPQGLATVALSYGRLGLDQEWDYLVCLHRAGQPCCEVWPIPLRQPLPGVRIPLAEKDPDLVLDLQEMLDHCYDAGHYDRLVDYRRPPAVPLSRSHARWANALLREHRLRG